MASKATPSEEKATRKRRKKDPTQVNPKGVRVMQVHGPFCNKMKWGWQ